MIFSCVLEFLSGFPLDVSPEPVSCCFDDSAFCCLVRQVYHILIHDSWKLLRRWVWPDFPVVACLLHEGAGVPPSTWCEECSRDMASVMTESDMWLRKSEKR